jgi:hypothetical protein
MSSVTTITAQNTVELPTGVGALQEPLAMHRIVTKMVGLSTSIDEIPAQSIRRELLKSR